MVIEGKGDAYAFSPYCGAPPSTGDLLHRWNLDPLLIGALALVIAVHAWRFRPTSDAERRRARLFQTGWALGALALISPLCPLSVSLFSARVGQHMLLTTIVAPLIALGLPLRDTGRFCTGAPAWLAALIFAAALWFWHAPGPYTATFNGDLVYWLMHITTFGAALWLWLTVFRGAHGRMMDSAAALAITSLQMAVLGAVITFAPQALYPPHILTSWAWGLSPLSDQQLGGAIMWVPAGVIMCFATVGPLAMLMREPSVRARPA